MILQSLQVYYDRKSVDPESGIAPEGFERKEIPFIIVIDKQGNFVQIEDTRYQDGKHIRAKSFLVPQSEKRSSGVKACLLWDNAEYIFGLVRNQSKSIRIDQQRQDFFNRIRALNIEEDEGISAVLHFLSSDNLVCFLEQSNYSDEIKETNPFMSFRLNEDSHLVCERWRVVDKIKDMKTTGDIGICLVSGEKGELTRLQPPIKGVRGTNSTGGNLVSFNLSAFNSFGKIQGANAQISKKSSFAYTTALNHLLAKDSSQKIQVGDATTVFWADKDSHFEKYFLELFEEPPKDNPDHLSEKVAALLKAVDTGVLPESDHETKFFILGLSPNAARISVRFWHAGTIAEFSKRIAQHFHDLELIHALGKQNYMSIGALLRATALQGKSENIVPNLSGEWMRCILEGLPYPELLFQAVMRRIKAEREVSFARAAMIKAYLNRKARFLNKLEEEITVSLDDENKNLGYRLGRLFAVLEKIQEEANPRINAGIREKYYSSASCTPASVMPVLMRLKNHHLAKLTRGKGIYFERLLGEILCEIHSFPPQLNLTDQGRFAIGYYHQRQAFITKSEISSAEG
ncbi:TPA: type I-C CRISPR-associated protein Cas8c/Csd1 [Legionella pneumophila]|uniref:type I-C CRISPR-associated protein Cas8c/Csd1 n=1 Tax=Legionella pneumophila TaxID=446 RepID=UPI0004874E37|nr:type I-C CRISPR-associated protein Cas8c/Csd1 [Legionella pneumophila]STY14734.1 CRISPR-associated protein Cas8c/Csd1, subtype I-C/DVULG [Legionella pneumophila]HAT1738020.1 type I-C CRISPR-associated protein Cas8c/Csd1 [Legionella pneumophila]HAT1745049.1 type I-C CRISPR-associated protein Cas8c/Csd1 [Legionella pneumophila]HAT1747933.1 type I-C CRISPR-associated protein Cas8c/Csd1 [Legionella pneumophila]HAT1752699.1 type I-C CRISPR-associated protein Cas8c/Csd1 [Legionella pneumophila]